MKTTEIPEQWRHARLRTLVALETLTLRGILSRPSFYDCPNCAGHQLRQEGEQRKHTVGICFWCEQTEDMLWEDGQLYIRYGRLWLDIDLKEIARAVITALEEQGLTPRWNGDPTQSIELDLGHPFTTLEPIEPIASLALPDTVFRDVPLADPSSTQGIQALITAARRLSVTTQVDMAIPIWKQVAAACRAAYGAEAINTNAALLILSALVTRQERYAEAQAWYNLATLGLTCPLPDLPSHQAPVMPPNWRADPLWTQLQGDDTTYRTQRRILAAQCYARQAALAMTRQRPEDVHRFAGQALAAIDRLGPQEQWRRIPVLFAQHEWHPWTPDWDHDEAMAAFQDIDRLVTAHYPPTHPTGRQYRFWAIHHLGYYEEFASAQQAYWEKQLKRLGAAPRLMFDMTDHSWIDGYAPTVTPPRSSYVRPRTTTRGSRQIHKT